MFVQDVLEVGHALENVDHDAILTEKESQCFVDVRLFAQNIAE